MGLTTSRVNVGTVVDEAKSTEILFSRISV